MVLEVVGGLLTCELFCLVKLLLNASHFPHAAALAAWDRHILGNRHALLEVEEELKRVAAGQDTLERKLYMLETHQKVRREASSNAGMGRREVKWCWCVVYVPGADRGLSSCWAGQPQAQALHAGDTTEGACVCLGELSGI